MTEVLLRTSERGDFKRCEWRWWMRWREGLTPMQTKTSLWFGTGWHRAMEVRYPVGIKRGKQADVLEAWDAYCGETHRRIMTDGLIMDDAEFVDAKQLGHDLLVQYCQEYGTDQEWEVLAVEQPFQIDVPSPQDPDTTLVTYAGTVDLVARHRRTKEIWIWDHKTARSFPDWRYLHIDDQGGSYLWVGDVVLHHLDLIKPREAVEGILFSFVRKQTPDLRPMDANGQRLNKDGTVSKKQPAPLFHREWVTRSEYEKVQQAQRVIDEADRMRRIRIGELPLLKNPTKDCPTQCAMFDACEMHERGEDWEDLVNVVYKPLDPYRDHREDMARAGGVIVSVPA